LGSQGIRARKIEGNGANVGKIGRKRSFLPHEILKKRIKVLKTPKRKRIGIISLSRTTRRESSRREGDKEGKDCPN